MIKKYKKWKNSIDYKFFMDKFKKIMKEVIIVLGAVGTIIGIKTYFDAKQQEKPAFVMTINKNDEARNITIINEGGTIKNVEAKFVYYLDVMSAQRVNYPTRATYYLGENVLEFNAYNHSFNLIEKRSFREEPYCEISSYIMEEERNVAVVPAIYTYFLIRYDDLKDKPHARIYSIKRGKVKKINKKFYKKILKATKESNSVEAENVWEFYKANRLRLGIRGELKRTSRMEEIEHAKTIKEFLKNNETIQDLDKNKRQYIFDMLESMIE